MHDGPFKVLLPFQDCVLEVCHVCIYINLSGSGLIYALCIGAGQRQMTSAHKEHGGCACVHWLRLNSMVNRCISSVPSAGGSAADVLCGCCTALIACVDAGGSATCGAQAPLLHAGCDELHVGVSLPRRILLLPAQHQEKGFI